MLNEKNNQAIGIFDSGLGGLMAVKEMLKRLPNENIVYFGDNGRVPYGTRSRDTIIKYAMQDVAFLNSFNVKMIISACGTVSSVATNLKHVLQIPFVGVVEPTAQAAYAATKSGKIGVIGTSATIASNSYNNELLAINKSLQIFQQGCPLFVPLIENGFIDPENPFLKLIVEHYLFSLKSKGIDTLILGCTHYPMISRAIKNFMGEDVTLIDAGREAAIYSSKILKNNNLLNNSNKIGQRSF